MVYSLSCVISLVEHFTCVILLYLPITLRDAIIASHNPRSNCMKSLVIFVVSLQAWKWRLTLVKHPI